MEYVLKRSKRKTASLTVEEGGIAVVRAPLRMPKREIDAFVERHAAWVERQRARQQERKLRRPPLTEEETETLKEKARMTIPERVSYYSDIMQLCPIGVKITSARKRFGSCSAKNSLCFSYLLMRYPPEAVDYVVVHELAHIRHKNHGAEFYRLVASVLPDYKKRRALLKS